MTENATRGKMINREDRPRWEPPKRTSELSDGTDRSFNNEPFKTIIHSIESFIFGKFTFSH